MMFASLHVFFFFPQLRALSSQGHRGYFNTVYLRTRQLDTHASDAELFVLQVLAQFVSLRFKVEEKESV